VRIDGGSPDPSVPEQNLDHPDVHTAFEQSRCIAMPQGMRRYPPRDPGCSDRLFERQPQRIATDRPLLAGAREEPTLVTMGLPEAAQLGKDWLRQWNLALFVTLADDANESDDAVDRRDFERRSLGDAQTARIHQEHGGLLNRTPYAANDRTSLGIGEDIGQTFALGSANSFFENSDHSRPSVWVKRNWMPPCCV
jgi:hypothetical protein